jgi:hypothetical protein
MRGDHHSERFTFKMPRYIEGHDMAACNSVMIHFINAETGKKKDNPYITSVDSISDLEVCKDDDTTVTFSWLVDGNATIYAGVLKFGFTFKCLDGTKVLYSWGTDIYNNIKVLDSISADLSFEIDHIDAIAKWKENFMLYCLGYITEDVARKGEEVKTAIAEYVDNETRDLANDINALESRMNMFTSLPAGSTSGNAEILDGRIGHAGKEWDSIGDHIRGATRQLTNEIDFLNEDKFLVVRHSIDKDSYVNNSYRIHFPSTINKNTKVIIKVLSKSYGYIQAETCNGSETTGVTVPNSIVNVGDTTIVDGYVSNRTNNLYVYSANDVECDVLIYIEKKTEIVVSKDGLGDYMSLDEALKNAKDSKDFPIVIKVKAGTYHMRTETPTDTPYKTTNRYLSIIGEDRNNCIIRNDNGYYSPSTDDSNGMLFDSSPLRISGNVTIENLTIISTDKNYNEWCANENRVHGVNRAQSYCVHSDHDCDENTTTLIRNCKLVNDHYCCIGAGGRKNHILQVENCELETTVNEENTDNGAIFMHSYNLNGGNIYEGQQIVMKNNVIVNRNADKSCYLFASSPDRIHATLIGNVSETTNTQNGFESFGNAYGVTKTELCFGNNIATMNS